MCFFFVFNKKRQMLRCAQHDRYRFSSALLGEAGAARNRQRPGGTVCRMQTCCPRSAVCRSVVRPRSAVLVSSLATRFRPKEKERKQRGSADLFFKVCGFCGPQIAIQAMAEGFVRLAIIDR